MSGDERERTAPPEILVVDDASANLQLLSNILSEHGYRVRPAKNGALALRSVAAKAPDLILLDVKMPEMDGFEVCRRLKAEAWSRDIPVLFISGLGEVVDKVKGFEAGGQDYIIKPFASEEVLARVKIHLRLHELTERLEYLVSQRTAELIQANRMLEQEIAERQRAEVELTRYREQLEEIVRERTAALERKNAELDKVNKVFIGRELRMAELKEKIKDLEAMAQGEEVSRGL